MSFTIVPFICFQVFGNEKQPKCKLGSTIKPRAPENPFLNKASWLAFTKIKTPQKSQRKLKGSPSNMHFLSHKTKVSSRHHKNNTGKHKFGFDPPNGRWRRVGRSKKEKPKTQQWKSTKRQRGPTHNVGRHSTQTPIFDPCKQKKKPKTSRVNTAYYVG